MTAAWLRARELLVLLPVLCVMGACDPATSRGPTDSPGPVAAGVITLGDIDPDEPATRVRRIQPLADFLRTALADFDVGRGRVVIGRDIPHMAKMIADGDVDFLLDSPYPVLAVNRLAGSHSILVRQAKDDAEYWSVFIALKTTNINSLTDLVGQVMVFQEAHSTSGFLLPVSTLLEQGFKLRGVTRTGSRVPDGYVGCHFSGDEENTVELILNGSAKVGVISNQDFRELHATVQERLRIIARTASVPRQLVAVRPGLDPDLAAAAQDALIHITDPQRARLAEMDAPFGWTWKFAELTPAARDTLQNMEQMMDRLPGCVAAQ